MTKVSWNEPTREASTSSFPFHSYNPIVAWRPEHSRRTRNAEDKTLSLFREHGIGSAQYLLLGHEGSLGRSTQSTTSRKARRYSIRNQRCDPSGVLHSATIRTTAARSSLP